MVNVTVKSRDKSRHVWIRETNESEPLIKCRKRRDVIKTGRESLARDKSGGNLFTVQAVAGIQAA